MEEGNEYRLYVGDIYASGYAKAKYSYISKRLEYALAFDSSRPRGMRLKKESEITKEEREWLLCCKLKINTEYVSKYKSELVEALKTVNTTLLDRLSKEEEDGRKYSNS